MVIILTSSYADDVEQNENVVCIADYSQQTIVGSIPEVKTLCYSRHDFHRPLPSSVSKQRLASNIISQYPQEIAREVK